MNIKSCEKGCNLQRGISFFLGGGDKIKKGMFLTVTFVFNTVYPWYLHKHTLGTNKGVFSNESARDLYDLGVNFWLNMYLLY